MPLRPLAVPPRWVDPAGNNAPASKTAASLPSSSWWLWPHLLSLDAPLVALAWQEWWSKTGGLRLSVPQRAILGLGVWMIYLADRLADNARGLPGDSSTARHAFARVRRVPLLILTALIGAGLVLLAPRTLPTGQFCAGLVLLAGAGVYFWLIHRRDSQGWTAWVPKEAAVGGMFALGTAFFALCHPSLPAGSLVVAVALFGFLCFLNCALITSWERNGCDQRDPFSFLNTFPWLAARGLQPMCWLLAGIAGVAGWAAGTAVFIPVVLASLALGILDRCRRRLSPNLLRFLVDTVLLTPWLCEGGLALTR